MFFFFFFTFKDKEAPVLLTCPNNIIKETTSDAIEVLWNHPTYSDNCGSYPNCTLNILYNVAPGSMFLSSTTNTVRYEARDPSGNVNEQCIFKIIIKKKGKKSRADLDINIAVC